MMKDILIALKDFRDFCRLDIESHQAGISTGIVGVTFTYKWTWGRYVTQWVHGQPEPDPRGIDWYGFVGFKFNFYQD